LLLVPALHLWLVAVNSDFRLRTTVRGALLVASLLPMAGIVVYYATTLGYKPVTAAWAATLLVAGHVVPTVSVLCWSIFLGCVVTAGGLVVAIARQPRPEDVPVTVRGPITYAGPGSLGGTKSALRR
jgi:hypothetical protein